MVKSGATTFVSVLVAYPLDTTSPFFAGLSGTAFGIDFNPVVDRLRITSNAGQNLRTNVVSGGVMVRTWERPTVHFPQTLVDFLAQQSQDCGWHLG